MLNFEIVFRDTTPWFIGSGKPEKVRDLFYGQKNTSPASGNYKRLRYLPVTERVSNRIVSRSELNLILSIKFVCFQNFFWRSRFCLKCKSRIPFRRMASVTTFVHSFIVQPAVGIITITMLTIAFYCFRYTSTSRDCDISGIKVFIKKNRY